MPHRKLRPFGARVRVFAHPGPTTCRARTTLLRPVAASQTPIRPPRQSSRRTLPEPCLKRLGVEPELSARQPERRQLPLTNPLENRFGAQGQTVSNHSRGQQRGNRSIRVGHSATLVRHTGHATAEQEQNGPMNSEHPSDPIRLAPDERRPFFTAKTLAEYLVISERTVREMISSGRLPSYRVEGARRISADDVDAYLERNRSPRR